jgi:hypothetical protein
MACRWAGRLPLFGGVGGQVVGVPVGVGLVVALVVGTGGRWQVLQAWTPALRWRRRQVLERKVALRLP